MNKVLLITGGTGSFGTAFLKKAVANKDFTEIRIFSRDEKKQDDLRKSLNDDRLKFYVNGTRVVAECSISGGSVQADTPLSQNYDLGFLTASKHQIGMNVEIKNKKNNKGTIIFSYKELDQLNRIIETIKKNY